MPKYGESTFSPELQILGLFVCSLLSTEVSSQMDTDSFPNGSSPARHDQAPLWMVGNYAWLCWHRCLPPLSRAWWVGFRSHKYTYMAPWAGRPLSRRVRRRRRRRVCGTTGWSTSIHSLGQWWSTSFWKQFPNMRDKKKIESSQCGFM